MQPDISVTEKIPASLLPHSFLAKPVLLAFPKVRRPVRNQNRFNSFRICVANNEKWFLFSGFITDRWGVETFIWDVLDKAFFWKPRDSKRMKMQCFKFKNCVCIYTCMNFRKYRFVQSRRHWKHWILSKVAFHKLLAEKKPDSVSLRRYSMTSLLFFPTVRLLYSNYTVLVYSWSFRSALDFQNVFSY